MAETWSPVRPNGRFSTGNPPSRLRSGTNLLASTDLFLVQCHSRHAGASRVAWFRAVDRVLFGNERSVAVKAVVKLDDESIPAWKRQTVQRSLRSAHARAHARSDRFVAAATRLLQEKGSTDFTVQDVVDRSKMSIRTFYKYFASKEDLLVAVCETVVAREAVPRLRKQIGKFKDPERRFRAYVEGL